MAECVLRIHFCGIFKHTALGANGVPGDGIFVRNPLFYGLLSYHRTENCIHFQVQHKDICFGPASCVVHYNDLQHGQTTYLLTYLLHGAESLLRSYAVNFAASQEIPSIYGTRKFLTVPTSDRHPSLS